MKWFGKSWGAPICDPEDHTATPLGPCAKCEKPICENDQGLVVPHLEESGAFDRGWHLDCFLGSIGVAALVNAAKPGGLPSSAGPTLTHVEGFCLCDDCLGPELRGKVGL